ncbi:hypothetical protein [Actinomadura alba]|uniref:Uncharacterized protein n=1 Tax=Actinomadura alba TaxID=406431 RepID=A0ABR7LUR6_9ACTN|nr:hypothetical protein [Actinomadura alba]MBC6468519.1 hypothetical protein [Actinomadura alba]
MSGENQAQRQAGRMRVTDVLQRLFGRQLSRRVVLLHLSVIGVILVWLVPQNWTPEPPFWLMLFFAWSLGWVFCWLLPQVWMPRLPFWLRILLFLIMLIPTVLLPSGWSAVAFGGSVVVLIWLDEAASKTPTHADTRDPSADGEPCQSPAP